MKEPWPTSIREPAFRADALKQTVSLTINSDLLARVKSLGINVSRVAEEALAHELEKRRRALVGAEAQAAVAAINAYEEKHGNFADHVRAHYGEKPGEN